MQYQQRRCQRRSRRRWRRRGLLLAPLLPAGSRRYGGNARDAPAVFERVGVHC
jgi:hypothetical protein